MIAFSMVMLTTSTSAISRDGIEGAIVWAEQQEAVHATDLEGWCQVWVQQAFDGSVPAGAGTAWEYFKTLGKPHEGAAVDSVPRGALVFFKPPNDGSNPAGHVGIALGQGQMVSTLSAGAKTGVWNTPIAYVGPMAGWAMPPDNWPGRPALLNVPPTPSPRVTTTPAPIPGLYVSTGYERGAVYRHPDFPTKVGLDNHDSISQLRWEEIGPRNARATGILNEDNCKPDCATGTYSAYPVEVNASDPKQCTVTTYQDYSDVTQTFQAYVYTTVSVRALQGAPAILSYGRLFARPC